MDVDAYYAVFVYLSMEGPMSLREPRVILRRFNRAEGVLVVD